MFYVFNIYVPITEVDNDIDDTVSLEGIHMNPHTYVISAESREDALTVVAGCEEIGKNATVISRATKFYIPTKATNITAENVDLVLRHIDANGDENWKIHQRGIL